MEDFSGAYSMFQGTVQGLIVMYRMADRESGKLK